MEWVTDTDYASCKNYGMIKLDNNNYFHSQSGDNECDDAELSSDEDQNKKVAQRKYEHFQHMCGDLLDPSKYK